jgi:cyclase
MTVAIRIIPCLDVDAGRVVKGVNFAELRDAGDPVELAAVYDAEGADELVFLDITASSGNRDTMYDVVRKTAEVLSVPLTVGGGVRTVADVDRLLRCGADKVGVNTAALLRREFLTEASDRFSASSSLLTPAAARQPKAASRSRPTADAKAPDSMRSTGRAAPSNSARARCCSTRWMPMVRPTATTSS